MTAAKSRTLSTDARIVRSRAAMRETLLQLLEERPLPSISGALIAERAKVGYATFFRHYADVRALVVDTVAAATDELAQAMMPALLAADSRGAAVVLVEAVSVRRGVFRSLFSGAGDVLRAELSRQVIQRLDALPDLSPSWLPRELATRIAVTGTIEVLDWWLREDPEIGTGDVAQLLDRLVIAPLGEPPRATGAMSRT